jgi:peptidoglycan/LPS O-acetylase OafA/YrhL
MKRIPSLDGLRAISITLVVLGHMAKSYHAPRIFWEHYAAVGVEIFFVISGFLITQILLRERETSGGIDLPRFYLRRSLRIFPAAVVFICVAVAFFWRDLRWYDILAALLYVANMDHVRPWIFGHLWSLSIEEQFYLVWPSVLKKWYKHRTAILVSVIVGSPVCQAVLYALKVRAGSGDIFPIAGDNIAFGCLLAIFAARMPKIKGYMAALCTLIIILVPLFPANSAPRTLLMLFALRPLLYFCIAAVVLHVTQRPYRALNIAPVVWLGRISYSLYLWQQPFCSDPQLRSGWFLIFALIFACMSYYFIEQPALRLRERLERADGTRAVSANAEVCATAA